MKTIIWSISNENNIGKLNRNSIEEITHWQARVKMWPTTNPTLFKSFEKSTKEAKCYTAFISKEKRRNSIDSENSKRAKSHVEKD